MNRNIFVQRVRWGVWSLSTVCSRTCGWKGHIMCYIMSNRPSAFIQYNSYLLCTGTINVMFLFILSANDVKTQKSPYNPGLCWWCQCRTCKQLSSADLTKSFAVCYCESYLTLNNALIWKVTFFWTRRCRLSASSTEFKSAFVECFEKGVIFSSSLKCLS